MTWDILADISSVRVTCKILLFYSGHHLTSPKSLLANCPSHHTME